MSGLEVAALTVRVAGRTLVDTVSLTAPRGCVTGIIGPNGAGKSTLLRAIAGLMPHTGGARLDGVALPRAVGRDRARLIGYLPQGHEIHWPVTARRTVALGRLPHLGPFQGLSGADQAIVDAALARTDSLVFAEAPVTTLSGGERARAMLARVLATRAPVLLADEPVAALDPGHQVAVTDLLREEAETGGRVVILVLHDLSLAARTCDRLVLMDRGRVVRADTAGAVLDAPELDRVYGVAFGRGHVQSVPIVTPLTRRQRDTAGNGPERDVDRA